MDTDPTQHVTLLASLRGITESLSRASRLAAGDSIPFVAIILVCFIFGSVGGILSIYIWGALIRWTSSWLGGKASSKEVRAALAWSYVPTSIVLILWTPQLLLAREEMFSSLTPKLDANDALNYLILILGLIQLIVGIWGLFIQFKTLGEVNHFSAWKGIAASVLAALVLIVPILVVVFGLAYLI